METVAGIGRVKIIIAHTYIRTYMHLLSQPTYMLVKATCEVCSYLCFLTRTFDDRV